MNPGKVNRAKWIHPLCPYTHINILNTYCIILNILFYLDGVQL